MKQKETSNEKRNLKRGKLKIRKSDFAMKKYIENSKQIIRKASANNKLVVFVGSGVSANSGIPMWSGIIKEIKERIDFDSENEQDNLVIAQYFYNSRGEKEYYDLLKEKLDLDVEPNELDNKILELNPYHIITTNYDCLLEKQAKKKGMFYDVVCKDSDLPYTPNGRMIIKMHGDFNNRNIVFKEDDYLSYSNNFKLIETFIKSIFATHTVLFVGYSLKDPDIKYIFKWVKDILKKDLPRPYFLQIDDSKGINMIEYQYYQNMGINFLYYSQIENCIRKELEDKNKEIESDTGRKTLSFLEYLLEDYNREYRDDELYNYIQNFKDLNYIDKNYFIKYLQNVVGLKNGIDFSFEYENELVFFVNKDSKEKKVTEFIKVLKSSKLGNEIKDFYKKLNVNIVQVEYQELDKKTNDYIRYEKIIFENNEKINYTDFDEAILLHRFDELEKSIKNYYTNSSSNLKKALQKAYALCFTGKYLEAYNEYKIISNMALDKKAYFVHDISEFNRFYCGRIVANSFFYDSNISNEVRKEVKSIFLEDLQIKWPLSFTQNDIIKDIINWNFVNKKAGKIAGLKPEIDKNESTVYSWISKESIAINKLKAEIKDLWNFINYNFFIIDNFKEINDVYYNYIDILLKNYMVPEKVTDSFFLGKARNVKIKEFELFDIMCMMKYINEKELEKIFKRYKVNLLEIKKDDIDKVLEMFLNVFDFRKNNSKISRYNIKNILLLLSKIKLSQQQFEKINEKLDEYYSSKELEIAEVNYLNNYIFYQFEKFNNYDFTFYNKILRQVLNKAEKFEIRDGEITIVNNITAYIKEKEPKKVIKEFDDFFNEFEIGDNFGKNKILIYFYRVCSTDCRAKISKKISNYLNGKEVFSAADCELYFESIIGKVIKKNDLFELKFLNEIDELKHQKEEEEKNGTKSFPDWFEVLLEEVGILKRANAIVDVNRFKKFLGTNDYFDFIYDEENFDYSKFNIEWIKLFPLKFLEKLSANMKLKEVVTKQIKEKIAKAENIDNDLLNKYMKYFI